VKAHENSGKYINFVCGRGVTGGPLFCERTEVYAFKT